MEELSLNILDIAQNSVRANATRVDITVAELPAEDRLVITINDNGCGMTPEQVAHVEDPFYTTRTTRKVGLGLPLFKLAAEQTGGTFSLSSHQAAHEGDDHGTTVTATFNTAHVDCEPVGDITETILTLIQGNPDLSLTYLYSKDGEELRLSTDEMREILGDTVTLNSPDVLAWARSFLNGEE